MRDAALLTAVAAAFAFGYFLMTRLDRFLEENRKAQEREARENNSPDPPAADGTAKDCAENGR